MKGLPLQGIKNKLTPSWLGPIWRLTHGQRRLYALALVALGISICFLYAVPLIPTATLDAVIVPTNADGEPSEPNAIAAWLLELMGGREHLARNLWIPALLMVLLASLAGGFTYLQGRFAATASESIARSVRDRLFDHLQHLPAKYFDKATTGDLVQRCTSDVETLRLFLSAQIIEIGKAVAMLLIPIPIMLYFSWRMTLASLILIPPIVLFSALYFRRVQSSFKQVDEAEGAMTATIQENLTGIRVVRAFHRQEFERAKFKGTNTTHKDLDYRLYVLMARFWSLSDLLCHAQAAIVVGIGIWYIAKGDLQIGGFYFFLRVVFMFIWPVRMLGRILTELGKATVALKRLSEILDEPLEHDPSSRPTPDPKLAGQIVFDNVTFRYNDDNGALPVLNDISFTIDPGQTVGILGPSGCGKSTVIAMLLRLYDYTDGSIRLDGHELKEIHRKNVRSQVSVVLQEPFLYSRSLSDNIKMGLSHASDEEMVVATRDACIHDSLMQFESGYDTVVGERGVTLSGGQRQRTALARALLQDPAILVLDDSLSAVDTRTEAAIIDALARRERRHTTIVIAHRLSTIRHADLILVMDDGRIIQSGTHDTLAKEDGLYQRLWKIQSESGEQPAAQPTPTPTLRPQSEGSASNV